MGILVVGKMRLLLVFMCLMVTIATAAGSRTRRPRRQHLRKGPNRAISSHTLPESPLVPSMSTVSGVCPEQLSLEEREERATLVFTGRVEWLPGNSRRVSRNIENDERRVSRNNAGGRRRGSRNTTTTDDGRRSSRNLRNGRRISRNTKDGKRRVSRNISSDGSVPGRVLVKRVFKGPRDKTNKVIQVYGLGGTDVCHSHVRVKDTRIFMTRIDDEGRVVLNSSLVRLTLKNLRKTSRAVQDVPHEDRAPIQEARDPCQGKKCHHGAICKPSDDGHSARCECPAECHPYAGGGTGGASLAVCGSDGRDYDSECHLRRHACNSQRDLEVKFSGKCDPCEDMSCPERQSCQLDRERRPSCRCNDVCSKDYDPVCASDGKTYTNDCVMKVAACKARKSLSIIYRDPCDAGLNPCTELSCMPDEECNIDSFGVAKCECPPPCQPVVRPVCGTDDITYDNRCELQRAVCINQIDIAVRYVGVCGEEGPCAGHVCSHGGVCVERQGRPVCECPQCPSQLDPVCGTDGISYDNECHLRAEACRIHRNLTVRYRGRCSGCENKECDFYSVCEADQEGNGRCVCPSTCAMVESKVCGTDGVTYLNECMLKVASCKKQQFVIVASRGDCDLCDLVVCKFGARCEAGRCICPTQCPNTREPVCASNGETFMSECEMQKAACHVENGLRITFFGECSEARPSVNFELTPCNGDIPKVNPATGRDFYCGRGPDTETCPAGYYCHWTLSFAKCCPLDEAENETEMGPSCRQATFGCCPDAKTAALGPNYAGCPSICQCHKLGAHSEICDPVTNQCTCKPGVGGTKCDRCEPGFWGLPRIQLGSQGCLPCGCSLFGSVRDDCEQMTGQCVCKPGISGNKCNVCPEGMVLGPKGCRSPNDAAPPPRTCSELECYFGARCQEHDGHAECKCGVKCPDDSSSARPVCGSDRETYTSECHLRLFACHYQKDVVVDALGTCPPPGNQSDGVTESPLRRSTAPLSTEPHREETAKATRHLQFPEYVIGSGSGSSTHSLSNSIYGVPPTPVTIAAFGLLGSICYRDKDCSVPYSRCKTSICTCRSGYTQSADRQTCVVTTPGREVVMGACVRRPCERGGTCRELPDGGHSCQCPPRFTGQNCEKELPPPYDTPSFSGSSFLEVKKIKAYNKVQVEMEFRTFTDSGLLLYSQQQRDGSGDFISLALVDGFVEFRYNLGSGPAVIRSHHRVQTKRFHRVVAKRYQRDGILQLDDAEDAAGKAPGNLKSLDLRGSTYLGYVPTAERRVWENAGTSEGLVGCLRSVRINGRPLDLVWPGSPHIVSAEHVGECSDSPCVALPCLNQGSCRPTDDGHFKCLCAPGYTGERCEVRLDPCESQPCQAGATCVSLPSEGFLCKCPPGRTGALCDQMDRTLREVVIPDFDGDAYLELPTLENVAMSFALEIWFLTRSPDGVLLYNGQIGGGGDFIALNLRNGHIEFTYNLGSGLATLVSPERVALNRWHVVRVRRKKRRGTLQLNRGRKVRGKSGPKLTELNLNLPLYLGGLENYTMVNPDSGVTMGLNGAIQRLLVNSEVLDNLDERATGGRGVRRYRGPPCLHNPCQNGGVCQPFLSRFLCKCPAAYLGKFCEKHVHESEMMKPVKFDGKTFLKFPNMVYRVKRSQTSNQFEVRFRATSPDGVLVWLNKRPTLSADYLAITINGGFVEFSFNLGKQQTMLVIRSQVRVDDGQWHTLVAHRRKRLGVLRVDSERPVKGLGEEGATTLNTNGKLWIGGSPVMPDGLPHAYYQGFRGCIDSMQVDNRDLNLVTHGDAPLIRFCDEMR